MAVWEMQRTLSVPFVFPAPSEDRAIGAKRRKSTRSSKDGLRMCVALIELGLDATIDGPACIAQ